MPTTRVLAACLTCGLAVVLAGCSGGRSLELTGEEVRRRLPGEVVDLIPKDAILCLDEQDHDGAYHMWILRKPGGSLIAFPSRRRPKLEHHSLPSSALEGILQSKLPRLDRGKATEARCRLTHWRGKDEGEIQLREIITNQGWFASVEQVRF